MRLCKAQPEKPHFCRARHAQRPHRSPHTPRMAAAVPGLVTHGFAGEAWNAPAVKENIEPAHVWMVNGSWRVSALLITTWFIILIIFISIFSLVNLFEICFFLLFLLLFRCLSRRLFRCIPELHCISSKWLEHPLDTFASYLVSTPKYPVS